MEDYVASEEIFLGRMFSVLSQVPGLLSKNVVKPNTSSGSRKVASASASASGSDGVRLTRTARLKMSEYYHDLLWKSVGGMAEKILLWGEIPGYVYLPYAMQHPRICLGLSNLLQDNLYAKFGGT